MQREEGFTLIELLVAMSLAALLMTLGAFSLRQYWLVRSLKGAGGEVTAQLRSLQQRAASESSPLIFGASFLPGTGTWSTFRYDLGDNRSDPADDTCLVQGNQTLTTGVTVLSTSAFAAPSQVSPTVLAAAPPSGCGIPSSAHVTVFYPKGTATGGHVDLHQPSLGRSAAVCVSPLTARVSQRTIAESASC